MLGQIASTLLLTCISREAYALPPELPLIPKDLSTPVAQRLAFNGPTGMTLSFYLCSNPRNITDAS